MAFTIEQIEEGLIKYDVIAPQKITELRNTPAYPIITDFLTGKTQTLPAIPYHHINFLWRGLVVLLNSLENPSGNDQLLMAAVNHPDMWLLTNGSFNAWMDKYLVQNSTPGALQTVIAILKQRGMTDDTIFEHFIFSTLSRVTDLSQVKEHVLYPYLKDYAGRRKTLIRDDMHWRHFWSILYFQLLEEEQPGLITVYLSKVMQMRNLEPTQFMLKYQDGKYADVMLEELRKMEMNRTTDHAIPVTSMAIYEVNPEKYQVLMVEQANRYLDYFHTMASSYYEGSYQLPELKQLGIGYVKLSVCTAFFLFKYDQGLAMQHFEKLIKKKRKLDENLLKVIYHFMKADAVAPLQVAIVHDAGGFEWTKMALDLLVAHFDKEVYVPILWEAIGTKSKNMRELLAAKLAEVDPAAEAKAIGLLEHKKADVRQMAAAILSYFDSPETRHAIFKVLNKEENEGARDVLLESIAANLPQEADKVFIQEMVAAARSRGKLEKPVETWLDEKELPALYYHDGVALDADTIRFLFYRMSRVKGMRSEIEARLIIAQLDKEKNTPFAKKILKLYIDTNAKPEQKYLLAMAGMMGDDEIVDKIRSTTNSWIEGARMKMAEYGVGALALQGSNKALRWVEWFSRKYRSKKAAVGAAATLALEAAAEELNITPYELGDRIVPDFGFEGLFREFTVNGESYRAFIDSNFKMAFFNEDNKKLKSLPAAADKELKEEFKDIMKEVRDVVKSQSSRLEHYLVVQRRWTAEQWQAFFLNNPIMFIYANRILWGVYDANHQLQHCFLCQEDTTLTNIEDDEIEIPASATVGIVHPLQLSEEELKQWQQKLFDLSIAPVFPQIDRPVYRLDAADKEQRIISTFNEMETASGSIKSTLEQQGWRKGPTGDGGMIDEFFKDDHAGQIMAVVEVEGVFVAGFDSDYNPKLGRVYFINTALEKGRWFQHPTNEKDTRLMALQDVPAVFYSEVIAGLQAIKKKSI